MDYGIAIPSYIDAWREVKAAEEAGFSHAWFYDSQLIYSDVYATMALARPEHQPDTAGHPGGDPQQPHRSGDCVSHRDHQ